jgi:membrane fusion protein, multidrug efflux system
MRNRALNAPATARARFGAAALAATILGSAHLATAVSCGGAATPPMRPTEISVRTAVAEARTLRRSKTYPGITASVRPVDLSARVQGFLETQHVKDGERVTAGTLIYSIDDAPFRAAAASAFAERTRAEAQLASALASTRQAEAQLAQVRAQVAGAQAAHDLAARDVERNRPLVATGAISKQAFDQYESKFVEAESQLEAAEASVETADAQRESAYSQTQIAEAQIAAAAAQLDTAELNLSYCRIFAPMDGLLGKSLVSEGQMVGAGYTVALNTLVQTDPMWVQFSPSATEWPALSALLAKGAVEATVAYGGDASISAKGLIVFAANAVDPTTSTIMLRAEFANPNGAFRAGTYSLVTVDLGELKAPAVLVPVEALVPQESDFFVWRVKSDSTVERVEVEVAIRDEGFVGIVSGIAAGDRIVTAGVQKLSVGSKVVEAPARNAG